MKDYFGTLHYPCYSDTHAGGEEDCDERCAAVARGERDELAAQVVALREVLRALAPNGHTADCIITTSFGGGQVGPCTTDCVEVAQALADPSPAVDEVLRLVALGRKAQDA